MNPDKILVIDLGSRNVQRLLDELVELGVQGVLTPHTITQADILADPEVKGIILDGGPNREADGEIRDVDLSVYNCPLPVLMVDHRGDAPWPEEENKRKETLCAFVFGLCGALPMEEEPFSI